MDPRGAGGVGRNRPDQKGRDRAQADKNARDNARAARATTAVQAVAQKPTITRVKKGVQDLFDGPDDTIHEPKSRGTVKVDPKIGPGTPGSTANFPLANPIYGPTQLVGVLPPGPTSIIGGILAGTGNGLADKLGLERGPQIGWSKSTKREDTAQAQGGGKTDIDAEAEERKRRRLAAQKTALGSDPDSLLGPNVLPI